jgi:hypothetical protein
LSANQPASEYRIEMLDKPFQVYPAGAVTLRLPVELAANQTQNPTELSVTYMACSSGRCLPPVVDKRVTIMLHK